MHKKKNKLKRIINVLKELNVLTFKWFLSLKVCRSGNQSKREILPLVVVLSVVVVVAVVV